MSTPLTRSQAKLWTLGAQAASLVCVLGAVAVGLVGMPDHTPGAALEQAKANAQAFNPTVTDPAGNIITDPMDGPVNTGVDTLGLYQRLSLLDNAPVPPVVAVLPDPEDVQEPDTGPTVDEATIARRVRYIGFINDARTPRAFVRIDGKQRIVASGEIAPSNDESLPDLRVERITPRLIILRDGDTRAAINLASKSGPSITMIDSDHLPVAAETADGTLLTSEEEEYIQSLPPRQQPRARQRLEREKRGLPADNPNRRPTPEPLVRIRGNISETGRQPQVRPRDERRND